MTADAQSQEQAPKRKVLRVPKLLTVKTKVATYSRPLIRYEGAKRVEHREAVEMVVETDEELPATAITPVLYVGDFAVSDYETIGHRTYRFYAFDLAALKEGAPVRLGWPAEARTEVQEQLRFSLESEPVGIGAK